MATEAEDDRNLLLRETHSKRRLPVNLIEENLPLFDHELQRLIPATTLLEFKDVRVSPDGILFKGFQMLLESFAFKANLERWKFRSHIKFFFTNYLLRSTRDFERDVLWITDDWSRGYFHWLTDVLPRLYVIRDRLDQLVLVLPHGYQQLEYVPSSLWCFNVKAVQFIGENEVWRCRKIVMPSHTAPSGHYNEQMIRDVRSVVLGAYGYDSGKKEDRLYISRARAPKRRIANEDAVLEILLDYGFRTLYTEDLSFEEQVKICSRASHIVSNHGAGLTNMLFAPEGANVLELRHHQDRVNNCYFTLASALNLKYFYQTCQSASSDQEPHSANLIVDANVLESNLRLLTSA